MSGHEGFYMARQPIYDRGFEVAAYELLYRQTATGGGSQMQGAAMEIAALANVLVEVGLDKLSGDKTGFVNVPSTLLGSEALFLLPPNRVTIEILEDTPWNEDVAQHIENLSMMGYRLAMDDYTFLPEHEPFLDHVDIVKVDVMGVDRDTLVRQMRRMRRPGQIFLAEKVETHEMVDLCMNLGFDLFQGYFFAKPNTIKGTGIPANYSLSISLLAKMQDPNLSLDEFESLIASNVALCHKVLRLVNSASVGMARPLDSIKQALLFLGTARIRTLASLALMTSMPGKLPELYNLAMVRARFCEGLAKCNGFAAPDKHFTVGLLSILDALTDMPMPEIAAELPLSEEIVGALCRTDEESPCSKTLGTALSLERGTLDSADSLANDAANVYFEAVSWAREQESAMAA